MMRFSMYACILLMCIHSCLSEDDSSMQSSVETTFGRSARSASSLKLNRYVREPMDRSSMIRFGKRAPMDRSAMIRFGKRLNAQTDFSRFLKRAPLDRSSMIRFGKRSYDY